VSPETRAALVFLSVLVALAAGAVAVETLRRPVARRTILVTGFGPFGGYETNPAWESARVLDGVVVGDALVRVARLDVVYDVAAEQLQRAVAAVRPDLVLCLGVAPDDRIRVETTARNRDRCPHPDNAGVVRADDPIRPDGPDAMPTRLPVERILAALQAHGFEAVPSQDAGGYLCNHVFYRLLDGIGPSVAGFVHVPELGATWDIERLSKAVRLVVETVAGA
jgi:pyroglutamyl-peptidase